MSAQRRWEKGDTTFDVEFVLAEDARKLLAEEPDAWPADHCTKTAVFTDFATAAKFACEVVERDWHGQVSISREVCDNPKYDWWETDGVWHVEKGHVPADLDPDQPDQ